MQPKRLNLNYTITRLDQLTSNQVGLQNSAVLQLAILFAGISRTMEGEQLLLQLAEEDDTTISPEQEQRIAGKLAEAANSNMDALLKVIVAPNDNPSGNPYSKARETVLELLKIHEKGALRLVISALEENFNPWRKKVSEKPTTNLPSPSPLVEPPAGTEPQRREIPDATENAPYTHETWRTPNYNHLRPKLGTATHRSALRV